MSKGLIVLSTEGLCSEEEINEIKKIIIPLLGQYEIALLEGRASISNASSAEINAERRRAIGLINRYFKQVGK